VHKQLHGVYHIPASRAVEDHVVRLAASPNTHYKMQTQRKYEAVVFLSLGGFTVT